MPGAKQPPFVHSNIFMKTKAIACDPSLVHRTVNLHSLQPSEKDYVKHKEARVGYVPGPGELSYNEQEVVVFHSAHMRAIEEELIGENKKILPTFVGMPVPRSVAADLEPAVKDRPQKPVVVDSAYIISVELRKGTPDGQSVAVPWEKCANRLTVRVPDRRRFNVVAIAHTADPNIREFVLQVLSKVDRMSPRSKSRAIPFLTLKMWPRYAGTSGDYVYLDNASMAHFVGSR